MAEEPFGAQTIGAFLAALASDQPAPGGGAAGALAAASGAALVAMVCRFSLGRPEQAAFQEQIAASMAEAERQRTTLLEVMDADAAAFAAVTAAYALPRGSKKEERASRREAIDAALMAAAAPPLQVAHASAELAVRARDLVGRTNPHLVSDLGSAGALFQAALRIGAFNVEANARLLKDDERAETLRAELRGVQAEANSALGALANAVQRAQGDGGGDAAGTREGGSVV